MQHFLQIRERATLAGCEDNIMTLYRLGDVINSGECLNIAVIGAPNSGKTTLINHIAGSVVRTPSFANRNEPPMLVTFSKHVFKDGFDVKYLLNEDREKYKFALYEMPLNMAIEPGTVSPTAVLESMDIVFYVISATSPNTVEDVRNLTAFAGRLPCVIVISKLQTIADQLRREEIPQIIEESCRKSFSGLTFMVMGTDSAETWEKFTDYIKTISIANVRNDHITALKITANQIIRGVLTKKLSELAEKKRLMTIGSEEAETAREQQLVLAAIIDELFKKQEEVQKRLVSVIKSERKTTESRFMLELEKEGYSESFCKCKSVIHMVREMDRISTDVRENWDAAVKADMDWMTAETERSLSTTVTPAEYTLPSPLVILGEPALPEMQNSGGGKTGLAIAGAVIALGAMILALTYPVAWVIAGVSAVLAIFMLKSGDENKIKYRTAVRNALAAFCEKSFENLTANVVAYAAMYYGGTVEALQSISRNLDPQSNDFNEVYREENSLLEQLKNCDM